MLAAGHYQVAKKIYGVFPGRFPILYSKASLFRAKQNKKRSDISQEAPCPESLEYPDEHKPLHFLNTVLRDVVETPGSVVPFLMLLKEIESVTHATTSALFITKESGENELVAITNESELNALNDYLSRISIDANYNALHSHSQVPGSAYDIKIIHLSENNQNPHGTLVLKIPKSIPNGISTIEIESIKHALSGILSSSQYLDMSKRLALHEERALIARELHDSLAQSLSYLKIQVSRLQSLLKINSLNSDSNVNAVNGIVEELRTNLNISYKQLRELITTFRLALKSRDLAHALEDSVEEFENRSSIAVSLDNRLSRMDLAVDEEIHVLQIIREAISNVVRHSQASRAEVSLSTLNHGLICINIDDDGIGMKNIQARTHRHGLIIMQQRAHELGGKFRVQASHLGGTRITATFQTKNNKKYPSDLK